MIFVKQYGYYRTGTNFLWQMLEKNFLCSILVNQLGCKHDAPKDWKKWLDKPDKPIPEGLPKAVQDNTVRLIVIVKDPYAWLHSFIFYWRMRKPDRIDKVTLPFLIQRTQFYNRNYRAWRDLIANHQGILIRYEDILLDYETEFQKVSDVLKLPLRGNRITIIEERVDSHPHLQKKPFDPEYYVKKKYLQHLKTDHLDLITNTIDWALFREWKYEPIG